MIFDIVGGYTLACFCISKRSDKLFEKLWSLDEKQPVS